MTFIIEDFSKNHVFSKMNYMPTSTEVLQLLERISNEQLMLAAIFHLLVFALLISFLSGWRPSNMVLGSLLSLPLFTVSALAWSYGNPFNGIVILIFFILLLILALRSSGDKVELVLGWLILPAVVMIAFGWFYPHFLNRDFYTYFVAAPTGLIPCPTLSLVIGFTLLFNGLHSKKWSIILAVLGLFYGIFGAFILKVYIDILLIAGSLALMYQAFSLKKPVG